MKCKRLNALYELVSPCEVFADIGSDHGFLACDLLQSGKAKKAVITDISQKSLAKAKKLIFESGQEDKAVFYNSDGFCKITEHIDTAIIAGMGGMEIAKILKDAKNLPNCLILQPMKDAVKLRELITITLNYRIVTDKMICSDNKFYVIIKAKYGGGENLTEQELYFGKTNLKEKSADFLLYLQNERKRLQNILENITKNGGEAEQIYKQIRLTENILL